METIEEAFLFDCNAEPKIDMNAILKVNVMNGSYDYGR